jgi:hypothetical protein
VLYVLALIAVVVGVDILFFRNQLRERLIVNVEIVLVFAGRGQRCRFRRAGDTERGYVVLPVRGGGMPSG